MYSTISFEYYYKIASVRFRLELIATLNNRNNNLRLHAIP
jgi:hypothetical protein